MIVIVNLSECVYCGTRIFNQRGDKIFIGACLSCVDKYTDFPHTGGYKTGDEFEIPDDCPRALMLKGIGGFIRIPTPLPTIYRCPECKDTGIYTGFNVTRELCRACGGQGRTL